MYIWFLLRGSDKLNSCLATNLLIARTRHCKMVVMSPNPRKDYRVCLNCPARQVRNRDNTILIYGKSQFMIQL